MTDVLRRRVSVGCAAVCCVALTACWASQARRETCDEVRDPCDAAGELRCGGDDAIEACSEDDSGCLEWTVIRSCAEAGLICESSTEGVDCAPDCVPTCNEEGRGRCGGEETLEACVRQLAGCLQWEVVSDCSADGLLCVETGDAPRCAAPCDECEAGATRCAGNIIQSCAPDDHGCLIWHNSADCTYSYEGGPCVEVDGRAYCSWG